MYLKFLLSLVAVSFALSAEMDGENFSELLTHNNRNINRIGEKVDVRLYYECLCPYCIDFYINSLNTTVAELGAYIDLKTYPYGNTVRTEVNGKTVMKCQHGPKECYGNKLHACAIDQLKNTAQAVYYVSCMMAGQYGRGSTDNDATECGKVMGINAKDIIDCAKGKKGEELVEYYGEETDKDVPDKKGVPWPLVNGKYIGDTDLAVAICNEIKNPPPQCKQ